MKVVEILAQKSSQVYTINPRSLVTEALQMLDAKHIGALLVLDEEQKIQGIISERDILHLFADAKRSAQDTRVQDIMTPASRLIIGDKDDEVEYVMNIMTNNRVRHLPIIDKKGTLVGLISIGDVIKVLLKDAEYEKKLLLDYIQGKYPA
ncbi:putative signal transduction protein with CBS domains [Candidatus Vecturithrix granuli]|uniref:Putative signal transduction protein with CBS domains n=1 Tax=Vecturithrix granuli TaxID=1499967 RepID=A0A081C9I8_VECG1|nr:putative signal transduction protein with CBS domains [Candidatus Vecturithrix granuli]